MSQKSLEACCIKMSEVKKYWILHKMSPPKAPQSAFNTMVSCLLLKPHKVRSTLCLLSEARIILQIYRLKLVYCLMTTYRALSITLCLRVWSFSIPAHFVLVTYCTSNTRACIFSILVTNTASELYSFYFHIWSLTPQVCLFCHKQSTSWHRYLALHGHTEQGSGVTAPFWDI